MPVDVPSPRVPGAPVFAEREEDPTEEEARVRDVRDPTRDFSPPQSLETRPPKAG